jgi:putative protease
MVKVRKIELMCPIRDWASLEACKEYADAVYFGVADLSLRANAGAIKQSEIPKFVKECHRFGLKAYLTVNSAVYDADLTKADRLVVLAKKAAVDAIIVWDPAIIQLAQQHEIPFIISTQANVSNWQSAEFYRKLGAKRVVLARELTLKQIKDISKKTKIELEAFAHGAMCYAISGRCLLSANMYGKSANCGVCGQPCRKRWTLTDDEGNQVDTEGKYFLSAKDLCMIGFIPELIKSGVQAIKIEGRRRDPLYVRTTAKCYREAIDAYYAGTYDCDKIAKWIAELKTVYNRGFSTGFYFGTPGKEGISLDKADNLSPTRKILAGSVAHYYPKAGVAVVALKSAGLKLGDEIVIEGPKTFIEQQVESMEVRNKPVKSAEKKSEVGVKIAGPVKINDLIFIIKK